MMHQVVRFFLMLVTVMLLLAITLYTTPLGTRWVVAIASRTYPEWTFDRAQGTLAKTIHLSGIHWSNAHHQLDIDHADIDVHWSSLWHGTLWINQAHIHQAQLKIDTPAEQPAATEKAAPSPIQWSLADISQRLAQSWVISQLDISQLKLQLNGSEHDIDWIKISGHPTAQGWSLHEFHVRSPEITLKGQGELMWLPLPQLSFTGQASVPIQGQAQHLETQLWCTTLAENQEQWRLMLLTKDWQNQKGKVSIALQRHFEHGLISVQGEAQLGDAQAQVDWRAQQGSFSLELLDFSQLWPTWSGRLHAHGKLSEKIVDAQFQGSGLRFGPHREIPFVQAQISGTPAKHQGKLVVRMENSRWSTDVAGHWANRQWHGQLSQSQWGNADVQLRASTPIPVYWSPTEQRIEHHCWQDRNGRNLCLSYDRKAGSTLLKTSSQKIPLSLLQPWLGNAILVSGEATGHYHWSRQQGVPNTNCHTTVTHGAFSLPFDEGMLSVPFEKLEATISGQKELNATIRVSSRYRTWLTLNAVAKIQSHQMELISATLDMPDYALPQLNLSYRGATVQNGQLRAKLRYENNQKKTKFYFEAQLNNAVIFLPMGTLLKIDNFNVKSTDLHQAQMSAKGHLGDGAFSGTGLIKNTQQVWDGHWVLTGKRLTLSDTPAYHILADIDTDIRLNQRVLTMYTKAHIPIATLKPRMAGNIILPSPDVVYTKTDVKDSSDTVYNLLNPTEPFLKGFHSTLALTFGEQLNFEGYGLSSHLGGQLTVVMTPDSVPSATGTIKLLQGNYTTYGQRFNIQEGQLVYNGGPVTEPTLYVRANRHIEQGALNRDMEVGIELSNTLQRPKIRLYSRPALPESQILSYLLLGQPNDGTAQSQSQFLMKLTSQFISDWSGMSEASENFFDQITIQTRNNTAETSDKSNTTALLVGKKISNNLSVYYGFGLFDNANTVRFEYLFNKHLSLDAETSFDNAGADLTVHFEAL
ncbi:MAG: translocation/assembly module TamB domain-containing protein [Pseudomonadota bacterium]